MSPHNKENSEWYLIYTRYKQEKTAKINLENQGFQAYLPRIGIIDRTQNLISKVEVMFPRYIFARFNIKHDDWSKIRSTKGVSHIVRFGNELATIDDEIITFFQKNSDETDIFHQQLKISSYSHGEKIIIKDGLLKGKEAIFLSDDGKKRARILLEIMNNKVITDLSKKEIGEKIDEQIDYIM
tara:strand:- start:127 stop:675 length:549 start_codon:yes stop_codon:yes gene_type:complete